MLTKAVLTIAILAACVAPSNPPDDGYQPNQTVLMDQHFCCNKVDPKTLSGEGCTAIGPEHINTCSKVLFCPEGWTKNDGDVSCV